MATGNARILHSGSKAQDKGDSRNHGLHHLYVYMSRIIYCILYTIYSRPCSTDCMYHILYSVYYILHSIHPSWGPLRATDVCPPGVGRPRQEKMPEDHFVICGLSIGHLENDQDAKNGWVRVEVRRTTDMLGCCSET